MVSLNIRSKINPFCCFALMQYVTLSIDQCGVIGGNWSCHLSKAILACHFNGYELQFQSISEEIICHLPRISLAFLPHPPKIMGKNCRNRAMTFLFLLLCCLQVLNFVPTNISGSALISVLACSCRFLQRQMIVKCFFKLSFQQEFYTAFFKCLFSYFFL